MSQSTGFQRLCLVTCAVIFGLIILGGVVRATNSGLGCPDWPTCHGKLVPRWEKHTLIEYSHRLTASVAGFLVLGIAAWAWRSYRRVPAILYPSLLALVLIIVQAGLGGAAVLNELPPEIVAVHLGMAVIILTILALITTTAFDLQSSLHRAPVSSGLGRLALAALAGTFALMLAGSYVSGAGYGLACSGWPLCNGDLVPTAGGASVQAHFLHRLLAFSVGLLLTALVWLAWRRRQSAPMVLGFAVLAFGVYLVQALVGAANVWTEMADEVTAAHLGFATLLWLVLAVFNIRVHHVYDWLPRAAGEGATTKLVTGVMR